MPKGGLSPKVGFVPMLVAAGQVEQARHEARRMAAALAPDLDDEVAEAVDHRRLTIEARRARSYQLVRDLDAGGLNFEPVGDCVDIEPFDQGVPIPFSVMIVVTVNWGARSISVMVEKTWRP